MDEITPLWEEITPLWDEITPKWDNGVNQQLEFEAQDPNIIGSSTSHAKPLLQKVLA